MSALVLMGMAVAVGVSLLTMAVMILWQRRRFRHSQCVAGILDSAIDGVFAVDSAWRLLYINDRARVLLDASRSPVGKCLWDVVPTAVASVFGGPCRHALEQQEPVDAEAFYSPRDVWLSLCAYPIPDGVAISFRDITASRRHREERPAVRPCQAAPVTAAPAVAMEDIPLADLLDQAAEALRPTVEGRGFSWLPGRIEPGVIAVRSDRGLLLRMIAGLVDGALGHARGGTIALDCRITPRAVQIVVRRSGAVAAPLPETGPAAVQSMSRHLNHPVEVHAAPEGGVEWVVTVPRGRSVPAPVPPAAPVRAAAVAVAGLERAPAAPSPAVVPMGKRFVLLVDDDPIVLMGLEAVLSEWGYDIMTAASADQAMERLNARGQRPDIVMADYQLRNKRVGTEVVARVRERFGPVPGVILTGETGGTCLADADAMGLTVMIKPVTPQQLAAALEGTPPRRA